MLNISDVMVLPSKNEGFGIVCIESFAMKVPIIRTKTGGYSDIIDFCIGVNYGDVNGRNAIDWGGKFFLDVRYVEKISFFLDLKIIFLTIKKVLVKEGINSKTSATTDPFKGNNKESLNI